MPSPTATYIPYLLEEHVEQLAFLLDQLQEALAQAPVDPGVAPYRELFHAGHAAVGAAAGTILAFHSALEPTIPQMQRLLLHEDAGVRQRGWHLVGYLGVPLEAKAYG